MKKILVIDDNVVNLNIAKESLKANYYVVAVTSGIQALKYLEKNKVDLILLDINMPYMNGYETLERIRKKPFCEEIPVIFVTAFNDKESVEHSIKVGIQYGVVDYIIKPYTQEELLKRIFQKLCSIQQ